MKKIKNIFFIKNEDENINFINEKEFNFNIINNMNIFTKFFKMIVITLYIISVFLGKSKINPRLKLLLQSKKFMNKCINEILINKNNLITFDKPNITVIIPAFNCEQYIKYSIKSIQNQNMNNLEILIINDLSTDKTLQSIEEMASQDYRIKIINNKKNMGTLYSRCIGVLKSNGKYIFPLDNDDLFMNDDVFSIAFNEAEIGKYDIVGFNAVRGPNYRPHIYQMIDDIYHDNPNNLVLHQPELGLHSITKDGKYEINNIHIWGKCIQTGIYKQAVNSLGKERYSYYMSWAEDTSMVFILFNIAKSYKFISIYGVYHLMSKITACYTQSNENKFFGEIFLLDVLFDYSRNDFKNKEYIVMKIKELTINDKFELGIKSNYNRKYLIKVLNKIFSCKYIKKEEKKNIKEIYEKVGFFNYTKIFYNRNKYYIKV